MNVRDQEAADLTDALETELRDVTGRNGLQLTGALQRLTGGFDTDTYAFELEAAPGSAPESLVLRHYRQAAGSDRPQIESTIQSVAARAGHPVPAQEKRKKQSFRSSTAPWF